MALGFPGAGAHFRAGFEIFQELEIQAAAVGFFAEGLIDAGEFSVGHDLVGEDDTGAGAIGVAGVLPAFADFGDPLLVVFEALFVPAIITIVARPIETVVPVIAAGVI